MINAVDLEQRPGEKRYDHIEIPNDPYIGTATIAGQDYPVLSGEANILVPGNQRVKTKILLPFSDRPTAAQMEKYTGILPTVVFFKEPGQKDTRVGWMMKRPIKIRPDQLVDADDLKEILKGMGLPDLDERQLRIYANALAPNNRSVPQIILENPGEFYSWMRRISADNDKFARLYQKHKLDPVNFPLPTLEDSELKTVEVPQIVVDLMAGLRRAVDAEPSERASLIQDLNILTSTLTEEIQKNVIGDLISQINNTGMIQTSTNKGHRDILSTSGISPADQYQAFIGLPNSQTDFEGNLPAEENLPPEVATTIRKIISLAQLDQDDIVFLKDTLKQAEVELKEIPGSNLMKLVEVFRQMVERAPRYKGRGSVKAYLEIEDNFDHQPPQQQSIS